MSIYLSIKLTPKISIASYIGSLFVFVNIKWRFLIDNMITKVSTYLQHLTIVISVYEKQYL